jgi:hypothetical protein
MPVVFANLEANGGLRFNYSEELTGNVNVLFCAISIDASNLIAFTAGVIVDKAHLTPKRRLSCRTTAGRETSPVIIQ